MKKYFIPIFSIFIIGSINAQSSIDEVLSNIAENNKTLISAQQFVQAKSLEYSTGNLPENPTIGADYMVGRPASGGNQFDLMAVQSFDFPTVYKYRNELASQRSDVLKMEYIELRQEILFQAKLLCIELIYLYQYKEVVEQRILTAQNIVNQFQVKFDFEQITSIELNKAKIQLLSLEAKKKSIDSETEVVNQKLAKLNGGQSVVLRVKDYSENQVIPEFEILIDSIESDDPKQQWYIEQSQVFETQINLSKSLSLPSFETGYHYQTVLGQTFNGVHFGLSIPLWEQKNTVKASKANFEMNEFQAEDYRTANYYHFKQLYNSSVNIKQTIVDYVEVFNEIDSEEILNHSLETGEIDFITYALELEYFYNARDELLKLEKQYQLTLAELFKYQL